MERRPLKTRETRWAKALARLLVGWRVRPNAISLCSVVFAAGAGVAFIASRNAAALPRLVLLIVAAVGIQLRLLCNMLDGMVAVEGKTASKVGDVFNEFPDRVADLVILASAGAAISAFSIGGPLGWCAGALAIMTAYVRLLGGSLSLPQDFSGPMAKPHRMATMTVASMVEGIAGLAGYRDYALAAALVLIVAGCLVTMFRRLRRIIVALRGR
jgi:phosphatidylglycerophosphate synthase